MAVMLNFSQFIINQNVGCVGCFFRHFPIPSLQDFIYLYLGNFMHTHAHIQIKLKICLHYFFTILIDSNKKMNINY